MSIREQALACFPFQWVLILREGTFIPQENILIPQLFVEIPQEWVLIPQEWTFIPQEYILIPRLFVEIPQHGNYQRFFPIFRPEKIENSHFKNLHKFLLQPLIKSNKITLVFEIIYM